MKRLIITLLLACAFLTSHCQEEPKEEFKHKELVAEFIDLIRRHKVHEIADKTYFPLCQRYPLPCIDDKQELISRYSELFDDSLTKMILSSDPAKDWSVAGWRGIMLHNGEIWFDVEGRLIAVTYHSPTQVTKRDKLIAEDKSRLHPSVQNFEEPLYLLETSRNRIRIDYLGDDNYRYTSWPVKRSMSEQPDLVIMNGKREYYGSGGNHGFEFTNNGYKYICDIIVMGEDETPPAQLTVFQGDKEMFTQPAQIIRE